MAKPSNLEWPCSHCVKWSEKEYKIHDTVAENNWKVQFDINNCEFDPRFAAPDKAKNCPYAKFFNMQSPMVIVTCDSCGKIIEQFVFGTKEKPEPNVNIGDGLHICNKCLDKREFSNFKLK
jgi:hypothetical protein